MRPFYLLLGLAVSSHPACADEAEAVKALEEAEVTVKRSLVADGSPVEEVDMANRVQVPEKLLKLLAEFPKLEVVDLRGSGVTDEGLAQLKTLKGLRKLYLGRTEISDAGLKHIAGLVGLESLILSETKVTDAGLKQLAGMKKLTNLEVSGTAITDLGLKELRELKALTTLFANRTKVTDKGVKAFKAAVPKCEVRFSKG
jgi:internalin A